MTARASGLGRGKLVSEPRLPVSPYKSKMWTRLLWIGVLKSTPNIWESRKNSRQLFHSFFSFVRSVACGMSCVQFVSLDFHWYLNKVKQKSRSRLKEHKQGKLELGRFQLVYGPMGSIIAWMIINCHTCSEINN